MPSTPSYQLTPRSKEALRVIARHTQHEWGRAQRIKYTAALYARFAFLAQSPRKGRPCDHLFEGLRCFKEGAHIIFYMIDARNIQIMDILHEKMDISSRIESWTQH